MIKFIYLANPMLDDTLWSGKQNLTWWEKIESEPVKSVMENHAKNLKD